MKFSFVKHLLRTASSECKVTSSDHSRLSIWGFRSENGSRLRQMVVLLFELATCGFLTLVFYWKPEWRTLVSKCGCALKEADTVLIRDEARKYVQPVRSKYAKDGFPFLKNGVRREMKSLRFFSHQKIIFTWEEEAGNFCCLADLSSHLPLSFFTGWFGWTDEEAPRVAKIYGRNEIAVPLKSISELLFREALNPFYLFQAFSVFVWFTAHYYFYSLIIFVISVLSIAINVYRMRKNQRALRNSAHSIRQVTVVRGGVNKTRPSTELLPGDIVIVPSGVFTVQCDVVLLSGTCIVNESSLTGDSVPVTKTPLVMSADSENGIEGQQLFDLNTHAEHTLFCGTTVLQTRCCSGQKVKAVVLRTGFSTSKGQLIRSIIYPKPVHFEFTKDLFRFVGVLVIITTIGFLYTVTLMSRRGIDPIRIVFRALDLINICIPPALPAVMTIVIMAAQSRLKKRGVYCICPSVINTCGSINAVCFDKTGTLTDDGLSLHGIVQASTTSLDDVVHNLTELEPEILRAMACCHSLTRVKGEVVGDPMDLVLFQSTGWEIIEPKVVEKGGRYALTPPTVVNSKPLNVEIGVLQIFAFTSALRRMSVIVQPLGSSEFILYCKGAPETVVSLCDRKSIPPKFMSLLNSYTKRGFYVLAFARKLLEMNFAKVKHCSRTEAEQNLQFLGLALFENRLKDEASSVICSLHAANIRCVMVTGDNMMTAISAARQCCILDRSVPLYVIKTRQVADAAQLYFDKEEGDNTSSTMTGYNVRNSDMVLNMDSTKLQRQLYQLAIDGPTFLVLTQTFPQFIPKVAVMCNVFARMSPDQKTQLINVLQQIDYVVAMCGDGANDCSALKTADAGISLSQAETSIASPFTSKCADVRCISSVIVEGRAALITSFGIFKYMACYSLIQFFSVLLLYWVDMNLADTQFLYIDLILITLPAVFFGRTPAADVISTKSPPSRILSVSSVCSVTLQLMLAGCFQVFAFLFVTYQPWFVRHPFPEDALGFGHYQITVVFLTAAFQYIVIAVVYSKSYPYRKTIVNNHLFFASIVLCLMLCLWITLWPPAFFVALLQMKMPPLIKYRGLIVLLAGLHAVLASVSEKYIAEKLAPRYLEPVRIKRRTPRFLTTLDEVASSPSWCAAWAFQPRESSSLVK